MIIVDNSLTFSDAGIAITKKTIDASSITVTAISGATTKVYDGGTGTTELLSFSVASTDFIVAGPYVMDDSYYTGADYNSKNVVSANSIVLSGVSYLSSLDDYDLPNTLTIPGCSISKAPLTISLANTADAIKVFDGTTDLSPVPSLQVVGEMAGEVLQASGSVATYNNQTTAASSLSVSGLSVSVVSGTTSVSNYSWADPVVHAAPNIISPKTVSASDLVVTVAESKDKEYDGTTNASMAFTFTLSSSKFEGEVVTIDNYTVANYNTKDVTTANTITIDGITYSPQSHHRPTILQPD